MSGPTIEKRKKSVLKRVRLGLLRKWLIDNAKVGSVYDLPREPLTEEGEVDFAALAADPLYAGLKKSDLKAPKREWEAALKYARGAEEMIARKNTTAGRVFDETASLLELLMKEVLKTRFEATLLEWSADLPTNKDPLAEEDAVLPRIDETELEDVPELED